MFKRLLNYTRDLRDRQRINIALSKGAAMMNARNIDLTRPATWEFSGFSQNGEDGILDILRKQLTSSNRYFVEIGSAEGIENNTAWLVMTERYNGLMVDGNPELVRRANRTVIPYSIGAECINLFVTKDSIKFLREKSFHHDPDVFSLDIDGNDYYIAKSIFDNGFRPKIFVVEYNSVYGPSRSMTIQYQTDFLFTKAHTSNLYYGVSITAWRKFFDSYGYKFVTVEKNGVNAFFVNPECFDSDFLDVLKGEEFAENQYQYKKFRVTSEEQFQMIQEENFFSI